MSNAAESGRKIVGWIAVATVAMSVATIVVFNLVSGPDRLLTQIVRLGLTMALAYFMWRGSSIARWISVVLFLLAGFVSVAGGLSIASAGAGGFVLIGMGLVYAASAGFLLFSTPVRELFRAAKGNAA